MSDKIISNIQLAIPENRILEHRLVQIEEKPRYYKIGNGRRNTFMGKGHIPLDAIKIMSEMTPQELWLINLLKDNIKLKEEKTSSGLKFRTSCISVIKSSKLSSSEKQKLKTGYKRLNQKNIVKRIKREHYIINPDFIIPHFYQEEKELFDNLS